MAAEWPMPMQPRSSTGILSRPLLMYCILAIWLMISPTPSRTKSANMKSITGRVPVMAAPRAEADEAALADRRVAQAFGAVELVQPGRGLEVAAALADAFAQDEDRRVAGHLLGQCFQRGLHEGDFSRRGRQEAVPAAAGALPRSKHAWPRRRGRARGCARQIPGRRPRSP